MRVAIYARYSSDLQNDRSIDDQVRLCRDFADKKGWPILDGHIYADRAISGVSVIGRTGLRDLLQSSQIKPRPFDYVLIEDTSRLSRKMGEGEEIIEQLRFYGIYIYFISQGINTSEYQSHLTVGVNSLIDSQYRRDLAKKSLRGMIGQAQRGYNTGSRTYGYKYDKEFDPNGTIDPKTGQIKVRGTKRAIDPVTSEIIKQMFDMYVRGLSISEITFTLNQKEIPPPGIGIQKKNGKTRFTWIPNTIRQILKNPKYIGDWTFNKIGWMTNPRTGQRKSYAKNKSEWTQIYRPELAIVNDNVWKLACERIKASTKGKYSRKGPRPRFLFTGLMKCHDCSGSYVVVASGHLSNPQFGCCTHKQRGAAVCLNNFRVTKNEIETTILIDIQKKLLSPPILSAIINKANKKLKREISKLKKQAKPIAEERKLLQNKIQNIISAIENGMSSDSLKKRLIEIETRLGDLDRQSILLEKQYNFDNFKFDKKYVKNWITNLTKLMNTDLPRARADLMSLIGEFTLSPEMVEGIRHLRVKGNAKLHGLLAIAGGNKRNAMYVNTGGGT